jgi:lycopene cyclase domain-containing protein
VLRRDGSVWGGQCGGEVSTGSTRGCVAMSYWGLNAFFLAAAAIVAVIALMRHRSPRWLVVLISGIILLLLTAAFDNVMIGVGLVGYNRSLISGVFIGIAPIEDFAYALAAIVLLPSLWMLVGRRNADD